MRVKDLVWMAVCGLSFGCGHQQSFQNVPSSVQNSTDMGTNTSANFKFPIQSTQDAFVQDSVQPNVTTLTFQAIDGTGQPLINLTKSQVQPIENGVAVQDFSLSSQQSSMGRVADIVFVLDSTESMQDYIDDVKVRVRQFVANLAKSNVKANLCLELFGDEVRQYCRTFTEDDLSTANNENVDNFLNEISKVRATGGDDDPENQLGALEAAATTTPWHSNSQRVAILITDEHFHYAPDHLGDAPTAPTYKHALQSVLDAHMQVFLMGPNIKGYNTPFQSLDPVPKASGGEWFDFDRIVSGAVDMSQILDTIVDRISVTYTVVYTADNQAGLNPALPMSQRNFSIQLATVSAGSNATVVGAASSVPAGHPELKSQFTLSATDANPLTSKVSVNGVGIASGYSIAAGLLKFNQAPSAGSKIAVSYMRISLRNNIQLQPITFNYGSSHPEVTLVLNGKTVTAQDFRLSKAAGSKWLVELNDSVFADSDPYNITADGGMAVDVSIK